ncbi:MAG TPA: MarR family winged helix-turn-helix transcriptional regulator [Nakamurella sp.]|jgi:DNA-binding MarR family transcriptional regulator|nr:MarR family winged helix-turn-helix transcriptional regulator [Nakamurella sp.]
MPETRWLEGREADAWRAVRDLGQPLWTALGRELQRESGLSLADYQVLVVLSAVPDGVLGYRELTDATGWEKSRLSHHLTRMEQRDLVRRQECPGDARSANVLLTQSGRCAIELAAPGHVASVRRLLIDRLTPEQIDTLASIGEVVRAALESCPDDVLGPGEAVGDGGPGPVEVDCAEDSTAAGAP